MKLAPIVLFVYNRPWHTEQTLNALELNILADKSTLYIFCDGSKHEVSEEGLENIKKVRDFVKTKQWCEKVEIIERDTNLGLAANVIDGITTVVNKHGSVIVLEDDLITSQYFLTYCNEGLEMYESASNIYAINAFQFPLDINKTDTFLCPLSTSSWGWATWKDKWNCFQENIEFKDVIQNHDVLRRRFNIADYDYASMLNNHKSWAIKWYYSVFLMNGLGLFPTKSLVENIGFDGSGENCGIEEVYGKLSKSKVVLSKKERINLEWYAMLLDWFTDAKTEIAKKNTVVGKIKNFLKE